MAKGTALMTAELAALPEALREAMAARMEKLKATQALLPGGGGKSISFKGGVITLAGEKIGQKMDAVILASQYERVFYASAYDPDNTAAPICYSRDGAGPHEQSHDKQHTSCKDCPHNRFGSAENGKGKACKEGLRLALVPPDVLAKPDLATTDIFGAKLSVTNIKAFQDYATVVTNKGITPEMVVTTVNVVPDAKNQYAVSFKTKGPLKMSVKHATDFLSLVGRADASLTTPYPAPKDGALSPRRAVKKKLRKSRMR